MELSLKSKWLGSRVFTGACDVLTINSCHVETVVLLSRKIPDAVIDVELQLSELDLTRSESKATYNEIREYIRNKYGFRVSNLNIAQVKRKHGIIEHEDYNARIAKNRVPGTPQEKFEAIEDALRFFKMIV